MMDKQRWYESQNDFRVRRHARQRGLSTLEQIELRSFYSSTGSVADRLPKWVSWLLGVVMVLYFGGGMLAPFFWNL